MIDDAAFRSACHYGHKETAEWLYNLSKTDNNKKICIDAKMDILMQK